MRKKTINTLADTIFWYFIYFLPILGYLIFLIGIPQNSNYIPAYLNLKDFINAMGFGFVTDNILITSLSDLFGASGVFPLFSNNTVFIFFSWFIGTYIIHLAVDFLLFIPRLAHKYMNKCFQGD